MLLLRASFFLEGRRLVSVPAATSAVRGLLLLCIMLEVVSVLVAFSFLHVEDSRRPGLERTAGRGRHHRLTSGGTDNAEPDGHTQPRRRIGAGGLEDLLGCSCHHGMCAVFRGRLLSSGFRPRRGGGLSSSFFQMLRSRIIAVTFPDVIPRIRVLCQ